MFGGRSCNCGHAVIFEVHVIAGTAIVDQPERDKAFTCRACHIMTVQKLQWLIPD
jgi:hypothetical protein